MNLITILAHKDCDNVAVGIMHSMLNIKFTDVKLITFDDDKFVNIPNNTKVVILVGNGWEQIYCARLNSMLCIGHRDFYICGVCFGEIPSHLRRLSLCDFTIHSGPDASEDLLMQLSSIVGTKL